MTATGLETLKVIEIAGVLAGPSVGMFFAELGAEVLKIENKTTNGDVTRSWKLPGEDPGSSVSAYFAAINWHKRYHFVDFNDLADHRQVMEWIKQADILIVNFKKGDAEKFGLDYEALKALHPQLIYGEISGFGADSDRVAYDLILQAESGFMSMNGTVHSGPVKMPVALIDILAGHQLKEGLLIALLRRAQTAAGCRVHVSLYESAIAALANQASNLLMTGNIPARMGSLHPNIAPYGELFKTADGKTITLAMGSDRHFQKLCAILQCGNLATNPKFSDNQSRVKHRQELASLLSEKIVTKQAQSLLEELNAAFVPAAQIKNLAEVFSQPEAQQMVLSETIAGVDTKRVKTVVFRIS